MIQLSRRFAYFYTSFESIADQSKQVVAANEVLRNKLAKAKYDATYVTIRNQWIRYDHDYKVWQQQCQRSEEKRKAQESQRKRRLSEEERPRNKAEQDRKWCEKKEQQDAAQAKAEEYARLLRETAYKRANRERAERERAESNRKSESEAAEEHEKWKREEEAQKRAAEQIWAEEFVARQRLRQQKEDEIAARERKVAERANAMQQQDAQERIRRSDEKEADARMRVAAKLARTEAEVQKQKRQQDERDAEEQGLIAIQRALAEDERKRTEKTLDQQRYEKQTTEELDREGWHRANEHRPQGDDEAGRGAAEKDYDHIMDDVACQHREAEAAEKFILEVMRIRGAKRRDILKDVVLITVEAVDLEIKAQRARSHKRKSGPTYDNPQRLPALIDSLFANLETSGEEQGRFRFSKKRKAN